MRRLVLIVSVAAIVVLLSGLAVVYVVGRRWMTSRETASGDTLPAGVPGRLIRVDGHRVHVVDQGEGPVVLLVHGTAGTTLDWETSVLSDLAQTHRVIAVDLYGMGFSDRDDAFKYGFTLWSDQLAGTLDALGIERVSAVGQSLGGAAVTVFAGRYPYRVDRVVSVDSGPWLPPFMLLMLTPGIGEMILGRSAYWPERPDQPTRYAERMRQVYGIRGTRQHLLRAIRGQFLDGREYFRGLSQVQCPVLLVHGSADDIIPVRAAAALRRLLKDSELVVIEGAGHFSMQDAPQRFVQEVERFIDGRHADLNTSPQRSP
jgi:2-hydroxymuconate-semialdehyde hydrolase